MEIFVDSADPDEVRRVVALGWVDGVTTNPTLLARAGRGLRAAVAEIAAMVRGPVSAEVLAAETEGMIHEGRTLAAISPNVVVKVPLTAAGLRAVEILAADGIATNVTLCFSPVQALLAAKAGATYVSPFVGRLDDAGHDGMAVVAEILDIYRRYELSTRVLVASVRHTDHVRRAALLGAHAVTVPPKVLEGLCRHPMTDAGLARFAADAAAAGLSADG